MSIYSEVLPHDFKVYFKHFGKVPIDLAQCQMMSEEYNSKKGQLEKSGQLEF